MRKTKFGIEIPFEEGKYMNLNEALVKLAKLCTDLADAVDVLQAQIDDLKKEVKK